MEKEEPWKNMRIKQVVGFLVLARSYISTQETVIFFFLSDFWFIFHNKTPQNHSVKQNEDV